MGFQLPSCPPSSTAPSGREHTDPTHWVGLCEAGSCSFPWAPGNDMELVDTAMTQRWEAGSVNPMNPDISLCFLEPCIRMQTSTSWTIHLAQWTQESAGICSNSEFASIFYDLCFPSTCRERSGKRAPESLCASGNSVYSALVSLLPLPSLHRRSILEKFCLMMRSG